MNQAVDDLGCALLDVLTEHEAPPRLAAQGLALVLGAVLTRVEPTEMGSVWLDIFHAMDEGGEVGRLWNDKIAATSEAQEIMGLTDG